MVTVEAGGATRGADMAVRRVARAWWTQVVRRTSHDEAPADAPSSGSSWHVMRRTREVRARRTFATAQASDAEVVYRCAWIRPIRLVVRLKILQLCGVMAAMVPLSAAAFERKVDATTVLVSIGVVVGASVASLAMWYYSRRFVGELALVRGRTHLRVSTLDFWGRRQDEVWPLASCIPPHARRTASTTSDVLDGRCLVPLHVSDGRQYLLAWRINAVSSDHLRRLWTDEWPAPSSTHAPDGRIDAPDGRIDAS